MKQTHTSIYTPHEKSIRYRDLMDSLISFDDHYQALVDCRNYIDARIKLGVLYRNSEEWTIKEMTNIANMGHFSSERTTREYAENI
ncbi:glycogen/starch/alpha-glucan phosphorylase [Salmonella enterica subsp. enterica serovar Saintpaul]|nr:glycogen/starch/alpha-glucan phosphorylase [Salmonella enterica subsp. enterica serovar Saintpaul]